MADKPSKQALLKLCEIIDNAQFCINSMLTDRHSQDGTKMYPVAISLLNHNIRELNKLTHGLFEGEE